MCDSTQQLMKMDSPCGTLYAVAGLARGRCFSGARSPYKSLIRAACQHHKLSPPPNWGARGRDLIFARMLSKPGPHLRPREVRLCILSILLVQALMFIRKTSKFVWLRATTLANVARKCAL